MTPHTSWVDDAGAALVTDLYELTMAAAYLDAGIHDTAATFELSIRSLPGQRNFLVAAGIADAIHYLEHLRFDRESIGYLRSLRRFDEPFLEFLGDLRFTGDVRAVREGTIVFGQEPLLQVKAPLVEAQIIETYLLAAVGFQTMIASKAARVTLAAGDRTVADFGARRAHGADAGLKAARAAYVGGVGATSLVLAGREYGIPVTGTMAHSYVLAHPSEYEAFVAFGRAFPNHTVLLIDTYDTIEGARIAADAAATLAAEGITVQAVRLDSGDLGELAIGVRRVLDDAGFPGIRILASGGLDEHSVAALAGFPIDGFGVGTRLTTSDDVPSLDIVYKLVEDHTGPRMKTSTGKMTLPGRKQVYRSTDADTIALANEDGIPGKPLLIEYMLEGERLQNPRTLKSIRRRTLAGLEWLPEHVRSLQPAADPYPVRWSTRLEALIKELTGRPARTRSDPNPRDSQ